MAGVTGLDFANIGLVFDAWRITFANLVVNPNPVAFIFIFFYQKEGAQKEDLEGRLAMHFFAFYYVYSPNGFN
ncbi:MAG: hypothetical protein NT067_02890 [Candidatus Diapherotrites archaeon]|nr:hypothetical protein [Candidatus Diapherotrites archaeon]